MRHLARLPTASEKEEILCALKGPQWIRKRHGSLYDRGAADSHFGRGARPHYLNDVQRQVWVTDEAGIIEYMEGYRDNEKFGDKKVWY